MFNKFHILCFTITVLAFSFNAFPQSVANYRFTSVVADHYSSQLNSPVQIMGPDQDNALSAPIDIGFDFYYNGKKYNQIVVSSNGFITFRTDISSSEPGNSLSNIANTNVIAPLWDDLKTAGDGSIRTELNKNDYTKWVRRIEFNRMKWNANGAAGTISFTVSLVQTSNVIEFQYKHESGAVLNPGASIGITGLAGQFISINESGAASLTTETSTKCF